MNFELPLWGLCGRIWAEEDHTLRYALNFGDPVTARRVQKVVGSGQVVRGQVRWTGRWVPAALERAGAPPHVVELARAVVVSGPGKGVRRQPIHDEAESVAISALQKELESELSQVYHY